jgi:phage terminase large subunit GpA-like protein
LQGRLRCETPGPGYLHFGQAVGDSFPGGSTDQFLGELFPWRRVPNRDKTEYRWEKPRESRDEGGDCTRYAYAVLQLVARRYALGTMWDQLENRLAKGIPIKQVPKLERRRSSYLR